MSIFDKINSGAYENKVPFKIDEIPVNEEIMTVRQAKEHVEAEKERLREQRRAYRAEDVRLVDVFKLDIEEEYGVVGHPKAAKLFEIAWSQGHSSGFNDVAIHYAEMVDLIRD